MKELPRRKQKGYSEFRIQDTEENSKDSTFIMAMTSEF